MGINYTKQKVMCGLKYIKIKTHDSSNRLGVHMELKCLQVFINVCKYVLVDFNNKLGCVLSGL